jgi:putative membrane protein
MLIRWLLAAVHLLGLGIGLGAVWTRARVLKGDLDAPGVRRALQADSWWAVAAAIWISTGLARAFAGFEKGTDYYLGNHLFWTKMALLGAILVLEVRPIVTFGRWRRDIGQGRQPDTQMAPALSRASIIQVVIVIVMVFLATAMARGYGA